MGYVNLAVRPLYRSKMSSAVGALHVGGCHSFDSSLLPATSILRMGELHQVMRLCWDAIG